MNIILVDDSFSARRALQTILESRGCTIRSFADIDAGLESFDDSPADAVFCDLVLQEHDGVEMWRRLRERPNGDRTPFALISGLIDDEVRARADAEGIRWLLVKPFSMVAVDEILEGVRAELQVAAEEAAAEAIPDPVDLLVAESLFKDLSGLRGLEEIAVFSERGDLVFASTETLSAELGAWHDSTRQLIPTSEREPGQNVIVESAGKVWIAVDLVGGQCLVCSADRFSAVGPVRFFALRRLAHCPPALSPDSTGMQQENPF